MICLVYAILKSRGIALPAMDGIAGAPIRYAVRAGLAAAFSELPGSLDPEVKDVLDFEKVVETLFSASPLIPVRFGNYFKSRARLENFLEENATELQKVIEHLEGKTEMGIRVLAPASPEDRPSDAPAFPENPTGKQYLASRKAWYEGSRRLSDRKLDLVRMIEKAFEGCFEQMKTEDGENTPANSPGEGSSPLRLLLSFYFLVPQNQVGRFRQVFSNLDSAGMKFLLSGPWPPYTFADFSRPS